MIRLIDDFVPVPRYGRQYHAIKQRIRTPIDDRIRVRSWPSSIPPMNHFSMIEVFGNTTKKEVKLDNPLSFDQCSISSVSLYTDFVLHNVPTDQVIVIEERTAHHRKC